MRIHERKNGRAVDRSRKWCRGAESNCLRRPFQGRALPVSYLGTGMNKYSTEMRQGRKGKRTRLLWAISGKPNHSAHPRELNFASSGPSFNRLIEFTHPVFLLEHFTRP